MINYAMILHSLRVLGTSNIFISLSVNRNFPLIQYYFLLISFNIHLAKIFTANIFLTFPIHIQAYKLMLEMNSIAQGGRIFRRLFECSSRSASDCAPLTTSCTVWTVEVTPGPLSWWRGSGCPLRLRLGVWELCPTRTILLTTSLSSPTSLLNSEVRFIQNQTCS